MNSSYCGLTIFGAATLAAATIVAPAWATQQAAAPAANAVPAIVVPSLAQQAQAQLRTLDLGGVTVGTAGNTVTLGGTVADKRDKQQALALVRSMFPIAMKIHDHIEVRPRAALAANRSRSR